MTEQHLPPGSGSPTTPALIAFLESAEFYHVMQQYRCAPETDPRLTAWAFEQVKSAVRRAAADALRSLQENQEFSQFATARYAKAEAQCRELKAAVEGLKATMRGLPPTLAAGLISRLGERAERAEAEVARLTPQKDGAYRERDALVAALSKFLPSHLARHPDSDTTWDHDWRWIVCVHGPTGQMTWHIHDSELKQFDHLVLDAPRCDGWDGHSTPEKYERLAAVGELNS